MTLLSGALLDSDTADSTAELLIQPSLKPDPSCAAIADADILGRLSRLDLSRELVYRIDSVVPDALPFLCEQFSRLGYDGWYFASTDSERRGLIKTSIQYHRLKGTLEGFRWAARLAKSAVVRAIQPPAKIYCGTALTVPERNAFLQNYPQLRLYPYRNRGVRVGMMCRGSFCSAVDLEGPARAAWCFPEISDAVTRLGEVGYLYRDGQETKIFTMWREDGTVEVRRGSRAGFGKFCNRLAAVDYPRQTDAAARIYRTRFSGPYAYTGETLHLRTVTPGLDPILIHYEMVALRGQAVGVFLGARQTAPCRWAHVARWLVDHRAGDRMFKRWHLFDEDVPVLKRGVSLFVGAQRFGMPAFHAEILTSIPGQHSPRIVGMYTTGFLPTGEHRKLDDTLGAYRSVTRYADRVKVNTKAHSKIRALTTRRASPHLLCGQFVPN